MEHLLLSSSEALNIVTARLMLLIHLSKLFHVARSFIKSFFKSSALVELLKNSIVSSERKKGLSEGLKIKKHREYKYPEVTALGKITMLKSMG